MVFCEINVERLKEKIANLQMKDDQEDSQSFEVNIGGKLYSFTFRYLEVEWNDEESKLKIK